MLMQGESQCFMSIMMIKIKTTQSGVIQKCIMIRSVWFYIFCKFKKKGYSMLIIFYKANIR